MARCSGDGWFWLVLGTCAIAAVLVSAYFRSVAGALAVPIRDNEIRVEFLGLSVNRLIHLKLTIAGALGGLGGALAALAIGHVDPNMAYWTTSGGFVFVTILAASAPTLRKVSTKSVPPRLPPRSTPNAAATIRSCSARSRSA